MKLENQVDLLKMDQIERFLNGELSSEELLNFEERYASDSIFAGEVEFQRDLRNHLSNNPIHTFISIIEEAKELAQDSKTESLTTRVKNILWRQSKYFSSQIDSWFLPLKNQLIPDVSLRSLRGKMDVQNPKMEDSIEEKVSFRLSPLPCIINLQIFDFADGVKQTKPVFNKDFPPETNSFDLSIDEFYNPHPGRYQWLLRPKQLTDLQKYGMESRTFIIAISKYQIELDELVEAIRSNDRKVIHAQYQLVKPYLIKCIKKELFSNNGFIESNLIDQIITETWARFWKKINNKQKKFRLSVSLSTYLYGVCKRVCWDTNKSGKSTKKVTLVQDTIALDTQQATQNPLSDLFENEKKFYLDKALKQLDKKDRDSIYYFFYENKDQNEIAEIFGISTSLVRQWRVRAIKKLRAIIKNQIYEFGQKK